MIIPQESSRREEKRREKHIMTTVTLVGFIIKFTYHARKGKNILVPELGGIKQCDLPIACTAKHCDSVCVCVCVTDRRYQSCVVKKAPIITASSALFFRGCFCLLGEFRYSFQALEPSNKKCDFTLLYH